MKKLLLLVLVTVMMAFALVLITCDSNSNCPGGGNVDNPGDCSKAADKDCTNLCVTWLAEATDCRCK